MEILIELLSKVPNVIWSAVIASLLTFAGVFITNKGNERRQSALLKHEKEKFEAENKLELKKEVFLSVASSFADVLNVIPKLMNLEFTQKDIETQIAGHSGIVAKSYLAAKEQTVAEILNFSSEVGDTLINLLKQRATVLDHKYAIEIYKSTISKANEEKDRIVSIMKEINLQGSQNNFNFDYLKQSYDSQDNIVKEISKNKEEEESILKPLHINFSRKCLEEHARLLSLLPPMTIALRKELDNDSESSVFIEALNNSITKMNSSFEKYFTIDKA